MLNACSGSGFMSACPCVPGRRACEWTKQRQRPPKTTSQLQTGLLQWLGPTACRARAWRGTDERWASEAGRWAARKPGGGGSGGGAGSRSASQASTDSPPVHHHRADQQLQSSGRHTDCLVVFVKRPVLPPLNLPDGRVTGAPTFRVAGGGGWCASRCDASAPRLRRDHDSVTPNGRRQSDTAANRAQSVLCELQGVAAAGMCSSGPI